MARNFIRASAQHGSLFRTNAANSFGCWFRAASLPASAAWTATPAPGTPTHPLDYMGNQTVSGPGIGLVFRGLNLINVSGTYKLAIYFTAGLTYQQWDCPITIATDEWHHVMYVIQDFSGGTPSTFRLWYDGVPQTMTHSIGTDTGGPGYTGGVNCFLGAAFGQYWDGDIAEAFAACPVDTPVDVDVPFTDDDAMEIADGRHPFWVLGDHALRPSADQRGYYFPLDSGDDPETDPMWLPQSLDGFGDRHELTLVNGPAYAEHPPLWITGRD